MKDISRRAGKCIREGKWFFFSFFLSFTRPLMKYLYTQLRVRQESEEASSANAATASRVEVISDTKDVSALASKREKKTCKQFPAGYLFFLLSSSAAAVVVAI